jgi:hypothetical protein
VWTRTVNNAAHRRPSAARGDAGVWLLFAVDDLARPSAITAKIRDCESQRPTGWHRAFCSGDERRVDLISNIHTGT